MLVLKVWPRWFTFFIALVLLFLLEMRERFVELPGEKH